MKSFLRARNSRGRKHFVNGFAYPRTPILGGIVGSTAYDLATANSDQDRLGVYQFTGSELLGLDQPEQSVVEHELSDVQMHELGKYVRLALKTNPTAYELLWLPTFEVSTPVGDELVSLRSAFLSARYVRDSYLGYANAQFTKLKGNDYEKFSAGGAGRVRKNARHMFRLIEQGYGLYTTGVLTIQVRNRDWFFHQLPEMTIEQITTEFERQATLFNDAASVLPENADRARINEFLIRTRRASVSDDAGNK